MGDPIGNQDWWVPKGNGPFVGGGAGMTAHQLCLTSHSERLYVRVYNECKGESH